jgi:hypothetical protein
MLCRKRQARENMYNLNRAANCTPIQFLQKLYTPPTGTQQDPKFEKDTGVTSTRNNIWKIIKRFTKHQTEGHSLVIHGRRGLTYTPLEKATEIAELYKDQF